MVQQLTPETKLEIIYPDSDGNPMADNTEHYEWINWIWDIGYTQLQEMHRCLPWD